MKKLISISVTTVFIISIYFIAVDPVAITGIEARWNLLKYEVFQDDTELILYLTEYEGEAAGSEKLYVVAKWLVENEMKVEEFLVLLNQEPNSDLSFQLKIAKKEILGNNELISN